MSRKDWFTVDVEGLAEMVADREPWQLAKEAVTNALDEPCTKVTVMLRHDHAHPRAKGALLVVDDDAPEGFEDLADAHTFFRRTKKRRDPTVRGRFNSGEKYLLAVCRSARIVSTKGSLEFTAQGVRRSGSSTLTGTRATFELPWTRVDVDQTVGMLHRFLPPAGKELIVNGVQVPHRRPEHTFEALLATVLEDEDGLRPTQRWARVDVHSLEAFEGERGTALGAGWLYELGIPVCEVDAPYILDVQQKIPLDQARDKVTPTYLRVLIGEAANVVVSEIQPEQTSATWVRTALESDRISAEAAAEVRRRRYGDKAVLWSSDTEANERAREAGYEVVHPRTLSPEERAGLVIGGLRSAGDVFGLSAIAAEDIPQDAWTPGMRAVAALAKRLGQALVSGVGPCVEHVRFIDAPKIVHRATWSAGEITFNLAHLPAWREAAELLDEHVELVLHELAHCGSVTDGGGGYPHGMDYVHALQRLAARCARLALERPEVFRW